MCQVHYQPGVSVGVSLCLWVQAAGDVPLCVRNNPWVQELHPALTLVSYFSKTKDLASPHMEIPSHQPPDLGTVRVSFHTPLLPLERVRLRGRERRFIYLWGLQLPQISLN